MNPPRSTVAQLASLSYHTNVSDGVESDVTESELLRAVHEIYVQLPRVEPDENFWSAEGELKPFDLAWESHLMRMMDEKTLPDSCPGQPAKANGAKNARAFLQKEFPQFAAMTRARLEDRIRLIREMPAGAFGVKSDLTGADLLRMNFRDVVRVFVKSEPHSLTKAELNRWRLIMNTSIVDIAVSRVVGQKVVDAGIEHWSEPSSVVMTGMGLDPSSIRDLRRAMDTIKSQYEMETGEKLEWRSADAKHWDWSVTLLLLLAAAEATRKQYGVPEGSHLVMALKAEAIAIAYKVYVVGSGEMYMDQNPGKQESGSLWTAYWNSVIRNLVSRLRGSLHCKAMGDDSVELWHGNFERHRKDGFKIEYPELPEDVEFEFCSHWFMRDGRVIPLNWGKTMFRLLARKPDPMERAQFVADLKDLPEKSQVVAWLDAHWA